MSPATVVSSLLGGTVFVGAGLVVAVTVKRRFFASWNGGLAVTTVVLVWLCWALALGQLLGAVGLLRRGALLAGALISAAAAIGLRRAAGPQSPAGRPTPPDPPTTATRDQRALTVATALLVFLVAAIWTARTVIAVHRGIMDPDSLGYHLPFIVTFAHSGYADQHRLLMPLLPVQFFPANDELLAAMALALTRSLAFAAAKNLLFGGLVLVAAHALGRAFGAARLTVAAAAIALGFPVMAFSQPGEAVNDVLLLLLVVGGLAVLAHARDRPAPYVLALACAGMALGVKFSGIVPAAALAALSVTLLLARVPTHRLRWAGAGVLASGAISGSWYVRNVINYGNPIPSVPVSVGPLHLHAVHGVYATIAYSVAHYAIHGRLLGIFARGLLRALGPLFVVTAALCLLGTVAGVRARDRFRLGLALMAAVGIGGYLVTPAGAFGAPDAVPESFVVNLHYAVPALAVGAMAGAIALAGRRWAWILPAVGVAAVAAGIIPGRGIPVWAPEMGGPGFALLLAAGVVGATAVLAWSMPSLRALARPAAAVATAIAVAGVAVIPGRYPGRRSTNPVVRWAATVQHAHIAEWSADPGVLYGPRAQHRVAIMSRLVDGAAMPIDTCQEWKQALRDGRFDYAAVVIGTAWSRWQDADPAFRLVADELAGATQEDIRNARRGLTEVYQITGTPDVSCPGQTNTGVDFWSQAIRDATAAAR